MAASSRRSPLVPALAGLLLSLGLLGAADNEVNVQFHAFQDTRGVTVLSPAVDLDKDFTDRTGLRLRFGVDAISAASDSCARCHQEGANNQRTYFSAAIRRKRGDTRFEVGGEYSQERFYQATTISTAISRALNKGNTTIAGGFAFSLNRPQLHPFQETMSQRAPSAYVAVTQTLTKTTAVQLGYELDYVSGYQSNPFLRAIVDGTWQLGVSPDTRRRQALTARLRQALPAGTFLEADYRRYLDSWSVHSDTLSVGLSHRFTPSLLVSGAFRHYGQTGAFFYQSAYTGTPQFFTGDFRLAPFNSKLYTLKLALTPKTSWLHLPADTAFTLQLERYESTSGFKADILSTGIRIPLKR